MQEMVRILLRLDATPHPDDAADALAIALCHVHSRRFAEATTQQSVPWGPIRRS
jgi:crossover junction endodeoxyribonuclease RuvC